MTICTTPKILVVEDVDGRAFMSWLLEDAGYKIIEMDDGLDALGHILTRSVDIVISDLRLPGIDGVELLKRTKAAVPDIEVILVTGYAGRCRRTIGNLRNGWSTDGSHRSRSIPTSPSKRRYLSRRQRRGHNQSGNGRGFGMATDPLAVFRR